MKKSKVFGRKPNGIGTYYNKTGKRDKDNKPIFEVLTVVNFTSKKMYSKG